MRPLLPAQAVNRIGQLRSDHDIFQTFEVGVVARVHPAWDCFDAAFVA